jgi:hypothetical protein
MSTAHRVSTIDVAQHGATVDVCGRFVDPTLLPPAGGKWAVWDSNPEPRD